MSGQIPNLQQSQKVNNRSFIIAKTIFFSHTISDNVPSGASTARSCRLSAPRSIQDERCPLSALSSLCCCAVSKHQSVSKEGSKQTKLLLRALGPEEAPRTREKKNNVFTEIMGLLYSILSASETFCLIYWQLSVVSFSPYFVLSNHVFGGVARVFYKKKTGQSTEALPGFNCGRL